MVLLRICLFRTALPGILNIFISVTNPRDLSSCLRLILKRLLTPLNMQPSWRSSDSKVSPVYGELGLNCCWILAPLQYCLMESLASTLNAGGELERVTLC